MSRNALGLVETQGLIAAIEATDAAAKAAGVVVSSVELTDAAFLTLKIEGELGAVQAAVEAAVNAAQKVGEIVAVKIIPNPDDGLGILITPIRYVSKYHPEENRPPLTYGDTKPEPPVKKSRPRRSMPPSDGIKKPSVTKIESLRDMKKITVAQLRKYARTLDGLSLKGREISAANKKTIIEAIKNLLDLE
jgi:microcompartment protein CcmL/EutN